MDFFTLMLLLMVVSIIGTVAWWALVFVGIVKFARYANRQLEAQMRAAETLVRQLPQVPADQRAAAQAQMAQMLSKVNLQLRQLDDLGRQRYDARVGELMGMAGSAGINWTPPS